MLGILCLTGVFMLFTDSPSLMSFSSSIVILRRLSLSFEFTLAVSPCSVAGSEKVDTEVVGWCFVGTGFRLASGLTGAEAFGTGVGGGVTSVEGETSTNSASRYHFRRRV